jgi:hypothetical protein
VSFSTFLKLIRGSDGHFDARLVVPPPRQQARALSLPLLFNAAAAAAVL